MIQSTFTPLKDVCTLCKKSLQGVEQLTNDTDVLTINGTPFLFCGTCLTSFRSDKPWHSGYKVVRNERKKLISSLFQPSVKEGGIVYLTNQINYPREGLTPLCVFTDVDETYSHAKRLFRSYTEVVYKCLFTKSVDQDPKFKITKFPDCVPGTNPATVYASRIFLLTPTVLRRVYQ